jgi:V/A-type H+-transporting ATPase subunit I
MAIVEMKKVFIIGMEREQEDILRYIQRFGRVEIAEIQPDGDPLGEATVETDFHAGLDRVQQQADRVGAAISFLAPYSEKKGGLFAARPVKTLDEMRALAEDTGERMEWVRTVEGFTNALSDIRTRRLRCLNLIEQVTPWEGLDAPFSDIAPTAHVQMAAGTIPKDKWTAVDPDQMPELLHIEEVGQEKDLVCVFTAYFAGDQDSEDWLKEMGFSRGSFLGLSGTASEHLNRYREELRALDEREASIKEQARQLAEKREQLQELFDALCMERDKRAAVARMRRTDRTFLLRGWLPAHLEKDFTAGLEKAAQDIYFWYESPGPDEDFPVLLDNPAMVRPFEMVTSLYSTPSPFGIDPNRVMAPFFFIFFGMMVSDAGYGVIMTLIGAIALWRLKPKGGLGKIVGLRTLGGRSTVMWGAFYGGWFGDWNFGGTVGPILFNPMADPIKTLLVCFSLGLLHVFVGMGVKAYKSIKEGHVWDAVFDQGFWYVFLLGLIMLALPATATVGKFMAIGGGLGLVLTQGRSQKGIIKKLLSGILSLYDTTGFLSDVLSYSRLFALGLATGVIASVMNQLAAMVGGSVLGTIFQVLILLGGHTFNIAINILGAFVHAARLQYIEFFGKFFEGGGTAFSPLSIKTKYVEVTDKKEAHAT